MTKGDGDGRPKRPAKSPLARSPGQETHLPGWTTFPRRGESRFGHGGRERNSSVKQSMKRQHQEDLVARIEVAMKQAPEPQSPHGSRSTELQMRGRAFDERCRTLAADLSAYTDAVKPYSHRGEDRLLRSVVARAKGFLAAKDQAVLRDLAKALEAHTLYSVFLSSEAHRLLALALPILDDLPLQWRIANATLPGPASDGVQGDAQMEDASPVGGQGPADGDPEGEEQSADPRVGRRHPQPGPHTEPGSSAPSPDDSSWEVAEDGAWLWWYGKRYDFETPNQRGVVVVLAEQYRAAGGGASAEILRERCGSNAAKFNVRAVFRLKGGRKGHNPAVLDGGPIQKTGKDLWALVPPSNMAK